MIVGYKGTGVQPGYVFAPYIPVIKVNAVVESRIVRRFFPFGKRLKGIWRWGSQDVEQLAAYGGMGDPAIEWLDWQWADQVAREVLMT